MSRWILTTSLALVFAMVNAIATLLAADGLVGDARNLSVEVVALVDDEDIVRPELFGKDTSLKLNVSWLPPESGRKPSFYSVLITGVTTTNKTNGSVSASSSSCAEGTIYYVGQDVDQTYALLPENRFGLADDETALELEIEPACTYRVQVFANPRNNFTSAAARSSAISTLFTVPECVGGLCNCDRALDELPVPVVSARSMHNGTTLISWKIESSNKSTVDFYKISVGIPHLTSSSGLIVYNKTQIFIAAIDENFYQWDQDKVKKGTKIFVAAVDSYGCSSKEGTYTIKKLRHSSFYRKNATALVFAGLIGLCLMMSGIVSFIKYFAKNYNKKLFSLRQKSTRQLSSVLHNPKIEALLKNHNILYMDQDIEEGRRKDLTDEYEISYKRLRIVRELGQGQFGKVYLANLSRRPESPVKEARLVAVKMSLTNSDSAQAQLEVRQQLLEEIAITKIAGSNPHLVGLIGCCTLPANPVCLVLEYMRGGDLLGYLHRMRDSVAAFDPRHDSGSPETPGDDSVAETTSTSLSDYSPSTPSSPSSGRTFFPIDVKPKDIANFVSEGPISHAEMMRFGLEIAKGMEHLELKGIVHRDLAARNILMDENLVVKISDFGLSRKGAYTLGGAGVRRLPIRWMPPEAIRRRAFTSQSDVWSYGLVLWEIGSLGDFPYSRYSADELLRHLLEEEGPPEPGDAGAAPPEFRELMELCWSRQPARRPNFQQIVMWLESKRQERCKNNPGYLDLVMRETDVRRWELKEEL